MPRQVATALRRNAFSMSSIQSRPRPLSISSAASVVLHAGIAVAGVATALIGPILPILIGRWTLSDQRAGLFFTAQFCGSMAGVASIRWLIARGYRQTFVCGFGLVAAGVAGLNLGSYAACLGATFVFGCGLGQALSTANLWVAEIAKVRRVAALSILNLQWGIGAIACSPLVMLAQRHEATSLLLYALAAGSALMALILAGMNLEPAEDTGACRNTGGRGTIHAGAPRAHQPAKHLESGCVVLSVRRIGEFGRRLGRLAYETNEF